MYIIADESDAQTSESRAVLLQELKDLGEVYCDSELLDLFENEKIRSAGLRKFTHWYAHTYPVASDRTPTVVATPILQDMSADDVRHACSFGLKFILILTADELAGFAEHELSSIFNRQIVRTNRECWDIIPFSAPDMPVDRQDASIDMNSITQEAHTSEGHDMEEL